MKSMKRKNSSKKISPEGDMSENNTPLIRTKSLLETYPRQIIAGGLILLFLFAWWLFRPGTVADVIEVEKGSAVAAVYGTVNVVPVSTTLVRTQNQGVISKVEVKEGDFVKQGQLLAEISDNTVSLDVTSAQQGLATQKKKLEIGPPSKASVIAKRDQVSRLLKLYQEGNISKIEYDRQLSELKTLENQMRVELLALQTAVTEAEQQLARARALSGQGAITSPQDGVVLDFYSQLGEVVTARQQLFSIASKDVQLRAQVNEEDVGGLKVGMPATVRLYSFPNTDFQATLKEVLPKGENMAYTVILTLNNPPENLLTGMTGELNIMVGKRDDTLVIPTRCLRNKNRLFVVRGGRVREKKVKVGFRSIEKSEVLEGVKQGDFVVVNDVDDFNNNQRVRVNKLTGDEWKN